MKKDLAKVKGINDNKVDKILSACKIFYKIWLNFLGEKICPFGFTSAYEYYEIR